MERERDRDGLVLMDHSIAQHPLLARRKLRSVSALIFANRRSLPVKQKKRPIALRLGM